MNLDVINTIKHYQAMFRPFIFTGLIMIMSCKKNVDNNNDNNLNSGNQFHKSIAIGETYYQNPEIIYSFKGSDQGINIIYPESDILKWVQFNSEKVVFKKSLQPTGSFTGFWNKGFTKTNNGNFVFAGTYWQTISMGGMYVATVDEKGSLINTKVISVRSGNETIRADAVYPARNGGYFISSTVNNIFNITRLNENAEVEWKKTDLSIKDVGYIVEIKSLAEDSNGYIFIATLLNDTTGTSEGPRECIVKMEPNGNIIWVKSLNIKNMDAHNNSDYNIKYLIADEQDNIYAFEEFHFVKRIMVTKLDTDGNILAIKNFDDNTTGLYDVQYRDQSFYILTGGQNIVKTLHLKINQNLEITKKGVVLAVGDLSELPGKFFRSSNDQFTDFIIAGKDEWDNNAWQYVRLNDDWKYPCYSYTIPEVQLKQHTDFSVQSWGNTEVEIMDYAPEEFVTSDVTFELKAHPTSNMVMGLFCKP